MMRSTTSRLAAVLAIAMSAASCATSRNEPPETTSAVARSGQRTFDTPNAAADALVRAAATFDVPALLAILGPDGQDLIQSADRTGDRNRALAFVSEARQKTQVVLDSQTHATLLVGADDWPLPIPIVKAGGRWFFDTKAGREEMLLRRIGANELDAITICRGYVEAQKEYALRMHGESGVHEYAQRIIATPGKHDGLAWQNPDGSWGGPIGERVAFAIAQGHTRGEPFHGYYFKVLKGQGSSAPLGKLDYVVDGVMIGGFALLAWPAQYGVTGVQTFEVSYDGVVYQKDLGASTAAMAPRIERYDPDTSWKRTDDDW